MRNMRKLRFTDSTENGAKKKRSQIQMIFLKNSLATDFLSDLFLTFFLKL